MADFLRSCLHVGVAAGGIAVAERRGWRRAAQPPDLAVPGFETGSAAALGSALTPAFAPRAGRPGQLRVVVADRWTRAWIVTPPRNAARPSDLRAAALARYQQLYGEPPTGWTVRADWDAHAPFLALALPDWLHDGVRGAAADAGLTLSGFAPHFVAAWNRWRGALRGTPWFAVSDGSHLRLAVHDRGRLHAVRGVDIDPDAAADATGWRTLLAREALRLGLPVPERLSLAGLAPAAWSRAAAAQGLHLLDPVLPTLAGGEGPADARAMALAAAGL